MMNSIDWGDLFDAGIVYSERCWKAIRVMRKPFRL